MIWFQKQGQWSPAQGWPNNDEHYALAGHKRSGLGQPLPNDTVFTRLFIVVFVNDGMIEPFCAFFNNWMRIFWKPVYWQYGNQCTSAKCGRKKWGAYWWTHLWWKCCHWFTVTSRNCGEQYSYWQILWFIASSRLYHGEKYLLHDFSEGKLRWSMAVWLCHL